MLAQKPFSLRLSGQCICGLCLSICINGNPHLIAFGTNTAYATKRRNTLVMNGIDAATRECTLGRGRIRTDNTNRDSWRSSRLNGNITGPIPSIHSYSTISNFRTGSSSAATRVSSGTFKLSAIIWKSSLLVPGRSIPGRSIPIHS